MEKLQKQPDVTRHDYYAFVNELKLFHQNKGTPFRHLPKINGREIDLQKLYNHVTALGGLQKVTEHQKWESIAEALKLPRSCVNFALSLRLLYIRFLGRYEKIHFMGEDLDHEKSQSSESHGKKQHLSLLHHVPMFYNAAQHELTNSARAAAGLNQNFVTSTDYDKLCKSFLSGLPNEQELALNVCTILSNEGNYMLHLEQAPILVDLLIAQAGIWPIGDSSLKSLHLESWKGLKGRNVHRFWRCCLDLKNPHIVKLLGLDLEDRDPDAELLNLESELGSLNVEGQRVLRIALILHNLSFERNNVPVLVNNVNFIRFLLLSTHSSFANLKPTAYDTLANLAFQIKLTIEKDLCSRVLFQTVMDGIQSADRYMNIRSMDILAQLCNYAPNEDIVPSQVDIEVYQKMVSFLTIHDIMLLFYTLEALYSLSDLGRYACDKIISVHRCVGILVSLLTLDPSQYGLSGHIKMKIVETLVPVDIDQQEDRSVITSTDPNITGPSILSSSNNEVDCETFACTWLKANYDIGHGFMSPRNEVYAEYFSFCGKAGRKGVVNANTFASCVKNCFPQSGLRKIETGFGVTTFHYDGIRKKNKLSLQTCTPSRHTNNTPQKEMPTVPASSPVSCKPGQRPTYSPILKAQLSAPPKNGGSSPPLKRTSQNLMNGQKCVSPSVPISPQNLITNASGSSTLIKSLLANKVQQRNLQRQIVPQNVSKMLFYSPDKLTVGQGIVAAPSTVVRCVRPGGSVNIRTPFQARFVSTKGHVITSNSPKIIKTSPFSSKVIPPKSPKQSVMIATTPRMNGVQMEVSSQDEDSKNSEDVYSPFSQLNFNQNHMNSNSSFDTKDSFSCDGDSLLSSKDSEITSDSDRNSEFSHIPENPVTCHLGGFNESMSSENLSVLKKQSIDQISSSKDQHNGTNISFVNNISSGVQNAPLEPQQMHFKAISSSTNLLKSMLKDLEIDDEDLIKLQLLQKDKICKKAPLLNGLLDKGKISSKEDIQPYSLLQNGNLSNVSTNSNSDELNSSISTVQSNFSLCVSSSSLSFKTTNSITTSVSSPKLPSASSSLKSDSLSSISSESAVNYTSIVNKLHNSNLSSVACSSNNYNITNDTLLNSSETHVLSGEIKTSNDSEEETQIPILNHNDCATSSESNTVIISSKSPNSINTNQSNGDLIDICKEQTTLSGTIELHPDQKGVVQLHIESPENSNQGSDLSSISDIARTLEYASQAISRTNAECAIQVPCETTATAATTTTLTRTGQQIIVVSPSTNQQQLHVQSPNIKFRILNSSQGTGVSEQITFPRIINQLDQDEQSATDTNSNTTTCMKRPSSDTSASPPDAKRFRTDTKTPLLEASLLLSVPSTVASDVSEKPFQETRTCLTKSSHIENLGSTPKLDSAKAVPVQTVDFPNEKEIKTFSGLSSASDNPSLSSPPTMPPKSISTTKPEYICEWKDCGLKFTNTGSVFIHASKNHTPYCDDDMICQWEGCDATKRRRFSLLTHLQDWHCNERVLHIQALRRKQLSQQGKTSIAPPHMPPPHPGYAPDAALLAIRRHALQYVNPKELSEDKESALTKSIRLTSALILRNLVTHSSLARTYARRFESELAYLAMSPVESARTIAQCLSYLSRPHD